MKEKTFSRWVLLILFGALLFICVARAQDPPPIFGGSVPQAGQSLSGIGLPPADIFALDNDNTLWRKAGCTGQGFKREIQIKGVDGQIIGIDFRPADGLLYGLSETGSLYTIDTFSGRATLVSALTLRFAGGVQSLMDFNPVANALRLIGSNDQNLAVVNSGGNLNLTVSQTRVGYALADVNGPNFTPPGTIIIGRDPNLTGGAYTNNVAGAANTIFYALDFNLDVLVTIAPPLTAAGSSNTGGGQLQTIGGIVNAAGQTLDIAPTADMDIYTFNGQNILVGISGRTLFTIDLAQINPNLQVGQTQQVVAQWATLKDGGFIDLAIGSRRCD